MTGFISREIKIGNLTLGGNQPVRIQSMTNTPTLDTEATTAQIIRLVQAGCEMVRVTAANIREAQNLKNIKGALKQKGIEIPLIADIHFQPEAAEVAAKIVAKVRINPGNYVGSHHQNKSYSEVEYQDELTLTAQKLCPLLEICKAHHTAIRIGINHGSLSDRILYRYGNTAEGMVASAMEFIEICRQANFQNLVLSLKASNVQSMVKANRLIVKRMQAVGYDYPIHLGLTEAGNGEEARIKSAAGIGSLLAEGIGDTIRVSLTETPEKEIPVARFLVDEYSREKNQRTKADIRFYRLPEALTNKQYPLAITLKQDPRSDGVFESELKPLPQLQAGCLVRLSYPGISWNELLLRTSVDFSLQALTTVPGGIFIENGERHSSGQLAELSLQILQALGLRYTKTEFIACPSCGRTYFDIEQALNSVKSKLGDLKGLKIAVMGCVVNGPGEMAGVDYGLVGAGIGKVNLYKGLRVMKKNIPLDMAVDALLTLIKTQDKTS